jgi:predicted homoserine dehydrogenase-like protein
MNYGNKTRIGIIGSGYIARGLVMLLAKQPDLVVSKVLTRRDPATCVEFPATHLLTTSIQEVIDQSDLVVECSGDVIHSTAMLQEVMAARLPVVTMDAELQATTGSYFVDQGLITEAEGDQPGCLAALHEEAMAMGFQPLVYGNIKGFLNNEPSPDEMQFWSKKQGISLSQVTAATDGTKVQFEQALVANGLGADIARPGLSYIQAQTLDAGANQLAALAEKLGSPISDCLLSPLPPAPKLPAGIFITGTHDRCQQEFLRYYKLGDGPYYTLLRPYYLPHLEIPKTIRRVIKGGGALLTNSTTPRISVAAVAKRALHPGEAIKRGIGSFAMRGIAVRMSDHPDHLPIGLVHEAVVRRSVEPGQMLSFADVDLPDTFALKAWHAIVQRTHRATTEEPA